MKKRRIMIASVMVLSMAFGSSAMAFAGSDTATGTTNAMTQTQREALQTAAEDSLETAIENLVDDGTLTDDEAEAILEALEELASSSTSSQKTGPFSDLTEDQISELIEETEALFEDALDELVDDEVLTESDAESLLEGIPANSDDLDLTDDQMEAVQEALADCMETAVENLVEDGTLSDDEAEAILEGAPAAQSRTISAVAFTNPFEDLTDDEITALTEEFLEVFADELDDLVDAGTITQTQADNLLAMYSATGLTSTQTSDTSSTTTTTTTQPANGQWMQGPPQNSQGQMMQGFQQNGQGQMMPPNGMGGMMPKGQNQTQTQSTTQTQAQSSSETEHASNLLLRIFLGGR